MALLAWLALWPWPWVGVTRLVRRLVLVRATLAAAAGARSARVKAPAKVATAATVARLKGC